MALVRWFYRGGDGCSPAERAFSSHELSVAPEVADVANRARAVVSTFLQCDVATVHVVGSTKFGVSLVHGHGFHSGHSDLDLAVVDAEVFARLRELASDGAGMILAEDAFLPRVLPGLRTSRDVRAAFLRGLQQGMLSLETVPEGPAAHLVSQLKGLLRETVGTAFPRESVVVYASRVGFIATQDRRAAAFMSGPATARSPTRRPLTSKGRIHVSQLADHPVTAGNGSCLLDLILELECMCCLGYLYVFPIFPLVEGSACFDVIVYYNGFLPGAAPDAALILIDRFAVKRIWVRMVPIEADPCLAATTTAEVVLRLSADFGVSGVERRILIDCR